MRLHIIRPTPLFLSQAELRGDIKSVKDNKVEDCSPKYGLFSRGATIER